MLVELTVENYAVIERVCVRFGRGLNLLTGETGSGKSIVVDSLGLLYGGRASAELVRTGAARARVSGIFEAPPACRPLLDCAGIEPNEELLIEREVLAEGKSRAWVDSRPVAVTLLRELAPFLGDIHGQHEQQRLFEAATQLDLLDAFAGSGSLVDESGDAWRRWRAAADHLAELGRTEQEKLRLADLWSFERREIEAVAPRPGEDTSLGDERRRLENVERLTGHAQAAYDALYDSEQSALSRLRSASRSIEELTRIDPALASVPETLRPAELAIQETALAVRDYLARLEPDPPRLEAVEARLAAIDRLKRKYGATIEEILAYLEQIRRNLNGLENADALRTELERQKGAAAADFGKAAAGLTRLRSDAARKLEKRVESELTALAMERSVFRIRISAADWSESGADAIEFLISPNPGEEPRPLDKVASGGELSRIALALKACAGSRAKKSGVERTLVFDEIDAGIGGRAAETVGRRLKHVAAENQVLCVTHLPQIAGFADHHFAVGKRESKGRTVAVIDELDAAGRTREIGRMLSGERVTAEALRHAEQLIRAAR